MAAPSVYNTKTLSIEDIRVIVTGFSVSPLGSYQLYGLTVSDGVGTFTWDTLGDMLLEKWCNGFSKNIDLRRGGNFCSLSGGSIYLNNCRGLSGFLEKNDIRMDGGKISIIINESCLFTGVVTGHEYNQSVFTLNYDDPTKYRNAIVSKLMEDGKTYYPALFGFLDKAKFVMTTKSVEPVMDTPMEYAKGLGRIGQKGWWTVPNLAVDRWWVKKLEAVRDYVESGSTNYYILCIQGKGSGIAKRITGIQIATGAEVDVEADYLAHITTAEQVYTEEVSGNRLSEIFAPYRERIGNNYETLPPDEYEQISLFCIYKVDIGYAADVSPRMPEIDQQQDFYTYKNGYVKLPQGQLFNHQGWSRYLMLDANMLSDDFGKADLFAKLEGRAFKFDYWYMASEGYDRRLYGEVFKGYLTDPDSNPISRFSWKPVSPGYPLFFASKYVYGELGLGVESFEPPRMEGSMFGDTHYTQAKITIRHGYDNEAFGIPFVFEFEQQYGVEEIMVNYDIVITMRPKDNTLVPAFVGQMAYASRRQQYVLLTAITDSLEEVDGVWGRTYPLDEIRTETFRQLRNNSTERRIRIQRINSCYDLWGFKDAEPGSEIYNVDALGGTLVRNGSFWRQDVYDVPEFISQQQSNPNNITNYVSGCDVIRSKGGGFKKIPPRAIRDGGTLKFRGFLAGLGFWYADIDRYHDIEFKNVQCLGKIEFDLSDGVYGRGSGRKGHGVYGWGTRYRPDQFYRQVLEYQNYETAHTPSTLARPSDGWGTDVSNEDPSAYNAVIGGLGMYDFGGGSPDVFGRQLFTAAELETENIKKELLRISWGGGYLDGEGKECVFDMLAEPNSVAKISYQEIIPGTLGKIGNIRKEDIFCEVSIKYGYDIASGSYLGEISVVGIGTDNPRIIDTFLGTYHRSDILDRCKKLYDRYKIINTPPTDLVENKWLNSQSGAIGYLSRWLDWQGAGLAFERREVSFTLPIGAAIEKRIDIGQSIEIEIPYAGGTFDGLITGVSWQFDKGREEVRCKAYVKMPIIGEQVGDIEETGYAADEIEESGERPDNIQEGGR